MLNRGRGIKRLFCIYLSILATLAWTGCNTTKHLKEDQYLLRKNNIKIKSSQPVTRRGELRDNLERLAAQKPNSYFLGIPFKLWLYNNRYEKYQKDAENFQLQSKTVEPPVIYDSTLIPKAMQNMKGYLYNQGFFYAQIHDTTVLKDKKAYVTYDVQTGINYLLKKVNYDIDDAEVKNIVLSGSSETVLKEGVGYSKTVLDEERRRISTLLKNNGYYKFSEENITFLIDTFNKSYIDDIENPFESAINFVALQKEQKLPTLDVTVIIRADEDPTAYRRYAINRVTVYPDFIDRNDVRDTTMLQKTVNTTLFKYHNYYIKEGVIYKKLYIQKGRYFSQFEYEETINKLNELGIFSTVDIRFFEDTSNGQSLLNCGITMNRAKKHDFSVNVELTNGTTYTLGNALSLSFRDRNIARGANFLRMSLSGGIESMYDNNIVGNTFDKFYLRTTYYAFNTSLTFPRFLSPFNISGTTRNLPRTILSIGTSLTNRLNYFTMLNITSAFTYNWRETRTKTWDFSPAFINIIRLPYISDSFRSRLQQSEVLKNAYSENFIEGENVVFTFTDREKNPGKSYSYIRGSFEEAGALLSGINAIGNEVSNTFNFNYAQYFKLDFDLQHFFVRPHSSIALRFYGGVGIPYASSISLPYIKQYYAGGAYSMRGWRIRTLGPGSSLPTGDSRFIDRTGDIKLEMNDEYRYDIVQLFSGAINLKGAVFADVGNIWLANKSNDLRYVGGEFAFNKLWQDIAIATGAGIRADIAGFFVIRADVAFPIKKPYVFTNSGWVIDEVAFGLKQWRSENMVLNIAIGYPF